MLLQGELVPDDIKDRVKFLIRQVHAEDERRADDAPSSEMRSVPAWISRASTAGPHTPDLEHVRVGPAAGLTNRSLPGLEADRGLEVGVPGAL